LNASWASEAHKVLIFASLYQDKEGEKSFTTIRKKTNTIAFMRFGSGRFSILPLVEMTILYLIVNYTILNQIKMNGLIKTVFLAVIPLVAKAEKPKNVLFITIDDLRTAMGCYGDSQAITPHMDQLARKGFLFEKAYCQQAVSGPSRASLLTGLRPDQIGVTDLSKHFREKNPDIVTLPQFFKNAGYQSVCIGKIYHGSAQTQDAISWSIPERHNLSLKKNEYLLPENRHGGKAAAIEVVDTAIMHFEDGQITNEVLSKLNDFSRSDRPFFLAVGYKKPHLPFGTPRKYWDMHQKTFEALQIQQQKACKDIPAIALHHSEELRGYTDMPDTGAFTESKVRELLTAYYACVTFIDDQIGQVLSELKRLNLDKNTVIVVISDHGFHLGEQGLWCKSTNFEIACKVPMIIYDPEYESYAQKIESIVELVDIYPTLQNLCGFDKSTGLAGQSLLPIIKGENKGRDIALSQFPRPYHAIHNADRQTHMGYTVRTKEWRYTLWYDLNSGQITNKELYYLPENSLEEENLSGNSEYTDVEEKLAQHIYGYISK